MNFSRQQVTRKPALISDKGMVSAQSGPAAQIGADVLAMGGNAADAAVAVSFALGIFEPWMSGIGGGGALVYWDAADQIAYSVDFGLRTSHNLNPENYRLSGDGISNELFPWPNVINNNNARGAHSIAVPGTVAGLALLHEKFGTLPWKDLLQPAIAAAKQGLPIDWFTSLIIGSSFDVLSDDADLAQTFLGNPKMPPLTTAIAQGNKTIAFPRLADTLQALADRGADDFYSGDIATQLIADLHDKGCCLSIEDLGSYRATLSRAGNTIHGDHHIYYPQELTAGSTLADALAGITDSRNSPDQSRDGKSSSTTPDAKWYAEMATNLASAQQKRWREDGDVEETAPSCTSHFSIADENGNLCSVTQTILSVFGSAVMGASTGVIMNNGVMWFDPEPGKPNSLAPNKRCLMNICPVVAIGEDSQYAVGAAGGRKILSCVAQLVGFMSGLQMDLETAFHQPRIDCSIENKVSLEQLLPDDIKSELRKQFDCTEVFKTAWPLSFAVASGVAIENGKTVGCSDPNLPWADSRAPQ